MRGISLLIYTVLLLMLYFVESSAFLSLSGSVSGVPLQIKQVLNEAHTSLSSGEHFTVPRKMKTYISGCSLPPTSMLNEEERESVFNACRHPYSGENWPGIICVFYDYYGYEYKMCEELLERPTQTYFFDGTSPDTYKVERDFEEGTFTLSKGQG